MGKLDNALYVLLGEYLPGGVTGVDHNQGFWGADLLGLSDRPFQLRDVQTPILALVQVVANLKGTQN